MSNNGSLSVNYNIDGDNITFKDVEIFSKKPIDMRHPLAFGTQRLASIRLKKNNIDNEEDKELQIAETFLNGKNLAQDFIPSADAENVNVPLADARMNEEYTGTTTLPPVSESEYANYPGYNNTAYPESEAATGEVTDETEVNVQPQGSLLGNIGSTISNAATTTGTALTNAASATGDALGTAASATGKTLGITSDNQSNIPLATGGPATEGEGLNQKKTGVDLASFSEQRKQEEEVKLTPMGKQPEPEPEKKMTALEQLRNRKNNYEAPKAPWSQMGGKNTKRNVGKFGGKRTKKGGKQRRTRRNRNNKRKTSKQ